jgi:ethanolamine utilization protein EutQ (cupin superfamily)
MKYFPNAAEKDYPSMGVEDCNAWIGDVVASNDPDKTIICGFFRMEKSDKPLVYDYTYDDMKCVFAGEFTISDESGKQVTAKPGDILYFPAGSRITFATNSFGVGFFCGQRKVEPE